LFRFRKIVNRKYTFPEAKYTDPKDKSIIIGNRYQIDFRQTFHPLPDFRAIFDYFPSTEFTICQAREDAYGTEITQLGSALWSGERQNWKFAPKLEICTWGTFWKM
jgi:hypothetical protein